MLQRETGRIDRMLPTVREALAIEERLARDYPDVTKYRRSLAATENQMAVLLNDVGRRGEAFEDLWWSLINSPEFVTRR